MLPNASASHRDIHAAFKCRRGFTIISDSKNFNTPFFLFSPDFFLFFNFAYYSRWQDGSGKYAITKNKVYGTWRSWMPYLLKVIALLPNIIVYTFLIYDKKQINWPKRIFCFPQLHFFAFRYSMFFLFASAYRLWRNKRKKDVTHKTQIFQEAQKTKTLNKKQIQMEPRGEFQKIPKIV